MKMDPTTESIAHFIGLFELSFEELRLRQDYLEFTLNRAAENEAPPLDPVEVRLQAPHEIGRYDPGLAYEPQAPELPPVDHPRLTAQGVIELPALPGQEPDGPGELSHDDPMLPEILPPPFGFPLETPGSVVSVTLQVVTLSDNDLFLSGLGASFTDPTELQATLGEIVGLAEALAGFAIPGLPQDSDWIGFAEDMLAQFEAAAPTGIAAEISTFRGSDAEGIFVDGSVVDEAPLWTELLPRYLQSEPVEGEIEAGTEGGAAPEPGEHDFAREFEEDAPDSYTLDPGHQIVAGANQAINEIALGSQWLDAPLIVVRGDVAKFDAVSQVNVLVEHDTIDGVAAGGKSLAQNVAEITTESSEDPGAPPPPDVLPEGWQVVRVEADLLQVNWVKQFTYATDFDRAEVTFSGQATFLGLGENDIVNATILNEFGYHYDLIFVAGDMVDGTVVSQKNVLFDSDHVTTREPATPQAEQTGAAPQLAIGTGDSPIDTAPAAMPAGPAPAIALAAATSDTTMEATSGPQEPAVADGDLPEPGIDAAAGDIDAAAGLVAEHDDSDPASAEDAEPAMSLSDNLLFNQATLKTTGIDTFVEMTESFAAAAEKLAEGAETIAREVAQDALFAGQEALRVLQIDGNLTKLNLFEQTNIVGDADQVRLEMQALREQLDAEVKLIAGSNALVNLATVIEHGVDSRIMAGGQVYDDAFIHQAELFDTDAVPNGVAISALANEAVAAFLSDDMLKPTEVSDEIAPTENYDASPHLDVMQTALA